MTLLVLSDDDSVRHQIQNESADVLVSCGDIADAVILHAAQTVGCAHVLAVKGNHDSEGRSRHRLLTCTSSQTSFVACASAASTVRGAISHAVTTFTSSQRSSICWPHFRRSTSSSLTTHHDTFTTERTTFTSASTDVSFDSMLKKYHLDDPALRLLAEIVRAADSHPANPHPAGEGLRWIAHGFSALGLSDTEILEREFIVYDALYAECQRRIQI